MLQKSLGLALCGVVAALVVNYAPAFAETGPRVVVQNQSEELFTNFGEAFGLRDYPFAESDTLWADSVYQDACSFIMDVASNRSNGGRRAATYLSRAHSLESKISALEREGSNLLASLFREDSPCPAGTSVAQVYAIGGCDFVTGVICVARDASSLVARKEQLLDMLVKSLERGVSVAATSGARRQRAKEIKSALTGLKDKHMEVRKKVGLAVFCK